MHVLRNLQHYQIAPAVGKDQGFLTGGEACILRAQRDRTGIRKSAPALHTSFRFFGTATQT